MTLSTYCDLPILNRMSRIHTKRASECAVKRCPNMYRHNGEWENMMWFDEKYSEYVRSIRNKMTFILKSLCDSKKIENSLTFGRAKSVGKLRVRDFIFRSGKFATRGMKLNWYNAVSEFRISPPVKAPTIETIESKQSFGDWIYCLRMTTGFSLQTVEGNPSVYYILSSSRRTRQSYPCAFYLPQSDDVYISEGKRAQSKKKVYHIERKGRSVLVVRYVLSLRTGDGFRARFSTFSLLYMNKLTCRISFWQ